MSGFRTVNPLCVRHVERREVEEGLDHRRAPLPSALYIDGAVVRLCCSRGDGLLEYRAVAVRIRENTGREPDRGLATRALGDPVPAGLLVLTKVVAAVARRHGRGVRHDAPRGDCRV